MARRDYSKEEMFTEPDPSSDNEDDAFMEEVFAMYEHQGIKPENLSGKGKKQYERYLKNTNSKE